ELRFMLARLRQLPALVLDLVEQPHVLDRDHRLVGEGGHQLDLLLGKWAHGASHQHDRSRVFSIAITAWAAKFVTSSICLSVNGRTSGRKLRTGPTSPFSWISGPPRYVRPPPSLAEGLLRPSSCVTSCT